MIKLTILHNIILKSIGLLTNLLLMPILFVVHLAAMLIIPIYIIRIVNVRQGTVITDVEIIEKEEYMSAITTSSASRKEFKVFQGQLDSASSLEFYLAH